MTDVQKAYFSLLKRGFWNTGELDDIRWNQVDFNEVFNIASRGKTLLYVYHGLNQLLSEHEKEIELQSYLYSIKMSWVPRAISLLKRNTNILAVQDHAVDMLEHANVKYCIIKGASVAVFYDIPEYRQSGDIDIYIHPDDFVRACDLFKEQNYEEEGTYSEYHTAYIMNGVEVEVHNSFAGLPVGKTRNSVYFLKDSCQRNEQYEIAGHTFGGPSVVDNAIIQLLHDIHHLVEHGMSVRQVCDWMMFVNKCVSDEVWDTQLKDVCKKANLDSFAKVLTKACAKYFGLANENVTWYQDADDSTVEAFMTFLMEEKKYIIGGKKREGLPRNLWDYQCEKKVNYNLRLISRTVSLVANRKKSIKEVTERYEQVEMLRKRLVKCAGFTYKTAKDYAMQ